MEIGSYAPFFHDGSIIHIEHKNDEIWISMESGEMNEEDLISPILLSKEKCIKGILKFKQVMNLKIDEQTAGELEMLGDCGSILEFNISEHQATFFVEWMNFPPKKEEDRYTQIAIEAAEMTWENNPELFDPFR